MDSSSLKRGINASYFNVMCNKIHAQRSQEVILKNDSFVLTFTKTIIKNKNEKAY